MKEGTGEEARGEWGGDREECGHHLGLRKKFMRVADRSEELW
jgi:hypothetical protein